MNPVEQQLIIHDNNCLIIQSELQVFLVAAVFKLLWPKLPYNFKKMVLAAFFWGNFVWLVS